MAGNLELWLPIKGYENFYEISSFGRVKGLKHCKILKLATNSKGYKNVILCRNGISTTFVAHRLVLETFVGPPPFIEAVGHHKDGNRINNNLYNLCWTSESINAFCRWNDLARNRIIEKGLGDR